VATSGQGETVSFRLYGNIVLLKDGDKYLKYRPDQKRGSDGQWVTESINSVPESLKGTMSNIEARKWYIEQNNKIPDLIDKTKPLEEQAKQACSLRNKNRFNARELMSDQELRKKLDISDPIVSFEELVEKKMNGKNLPREEALADIIKTSNKTRRSTNKVLGLEE